MFRSVTISVHLQNKIITTELIFMKPQQHKDSRAHTLKYIPVALNSLISDLKINECVKLQKPPY